MAGTIWTGEKTFIVSGSETVLIPVPAPHRGILRGYRIIQTSGPDGGMAYSIFTSKKVADFDPDSPASDGLRKQLELVQGSVAAMGDGIGDPDLNLAYINRDGTPTNPQRFLYVEVTPALPENTREYSITITIETPTLR